MAEKIIEFEKVVAGYSPSLTILNETTLDARKGEITLLIGPNGAGKSTVLKTLFGMLVPRSGEIRFEGKRIDGLSPGRIADMGLIRTFQTARVFPGMTVQENILAGHHRMIRHGFMPQALWLPGTRREERELAARADALLELVMLSRFHDTHATELPMGAQKLLEVLRALMAQPRVLLLDEPAAGLNDTETAELAALLLAIRESGITVLVVEHNMSLVMGVADAIVVLEAGAVIATGTPAEIQRNERVIKAYLG